MHPDPKPPAWAPDTEVGPALPRWRPGRASVSLGVTAWKREGSLVPLGTEIALAFAVGLASFVLVAVTFKSVEATALVIAAVVGFGAAIFWIVRAWGAGYRFVATEEAGDRATRRPLRVVPSRQPLARDRRAA